jgi:hypothetical protein
LNHARSFRLAECSPRLTRLAHEVEAMLPALQAILGEFMKRTAFLLFCILANTVGASAKPLAETDPLFETLRANDSIVFDRGLNNCEIGVYETIMADDLEFYHDMDGLMVGKDALIANTRDGICKDPGVLRRELIPGSLAVYPLSDNGVVYGAIQTGRHQFYLKGSDGAEHLDGIARFTHIWVKSGDDWKLKRVLSYDHADPNAE